MQIIKFVWFVSLVAMLAGISRGAEAFRKDINPALKYYQAFLEAPDLSPRDRDYLFTSEWRGQVLEPKFGKLAAKYDNMFRYLREARYAEVPCDWGIDLTEGPDALLPGLAKAKAVAQAARVRAQWALQNGRETEGREDLLAAFALARNASRDGVLISALVQIAMENMIFSFVAENYYRFSRDALKQLAAGFDSSPARGTVAQCIPVERQFFHDWFLRKIEAAQKDNPGNEARVLEQARACLLRTQGNESSDLEFPESVIKASGGTVSGLTELIRGMEPFYERAASILSLPYQEFGPQIKAFDEETASHPNPLVTNFFRVFDRCKQREFTAVVRMALVRAATEYKLHGEEGLKSVSDPCGNGPFAFRRFIFEGVDRGFELKSAYKGRDGNEILIFVEKDGAPFRVEGKDAGKAIR